MRVYVLGKWYGKENYEMFLLAQSLFEEAGYDVIRQQDILPQEKGRKVVDMENELMQSADIVVRLYRGDAQSDEASYEGTMAVVKYGKPLVTLIYPGFSENDMPSCLLAYSRRIIRLERMQQIRGIRLEEFL